MSLSRVAAVAAASVLSLLAVSGCAAGAASSPVPTSSAAGDALVLAEPPAGRVVGTGTVLDVGGHPELCLGAVAESYPPQCSGVPLEGWTWEGVEGSESQGETTWGAYAVQGTFDGDVFTVTDPPIVLALYDPIRSDDPAGGVEGSAPDDELVLAQTEVTDELGSAVLASWAERGYLWLQVVWDDGTLQDAVDARYGDGVALVTSALRGVD